MKCIVLDDEPLALRVIENHLNGLPQVEPVGFYTDHEQVREKLTEHTVDLLLLDIQMPDVNGMHFYRSLSTPPPVIFTTAFRNFAVEGFELDALDYLVKPIDFGRFARAIHKAERSLQRNASPDPLPDIYVYSAYEMRRVSLSDLYAVATYGDYLKLYLYSQQKPLITLMSLKKLLEQLPATDFVRVHRSFVVAISAISSRRGSSLCVQDLTVPVGRTFAKQVRKVFG
ncbi:MAG: LytTR family DNA-binding domain-containing protein [Bacteroidota bacterium]